VRTRFLADANLNHQIVAGILRREPDVDFLWGVLADLTGLPDSQVLALAAADRRILVTHDVHTIPSAFAEFLSANTSSGVILVPQYLPVGIAIESLLRVWEEYTPEEWINRIVRVPF